MRETISALPSAFRIRMFGDCTTHLALVHPLVIYPEVGKFHQYELHPKIPLSHQSEQLQGLQNNAPAIGAQNE